MRIVRIDLNNEKLTSENIQKDSSYFLLGGRGLSSLMVHKEVPPLCDPLGEENKLIITNGLLAGSPFPNSGRTSVGAKSPLTNGIKEANVGGRPAMMLAFHGIRAIILEGISSDLKLIVVNDEGIQIEDAKEFKGIGNYELHSKLKNIYGENVGIYSIGPAGELLMKSATVAANDLEGYPSRHAARGGLGAVMGSKRVKGIVISPTRHPRFFMHDLKQFRQISKPFAKNLAESKKNFSLYGTPNMVIPMSTYGGLPTKNFRRGSFEKASEISGERLHELVTERNGRKRVSCSPTCVIKCSNIFVDEEGNHVTSSLEYETIFANGSNLSIDNLDDIAKIDHLCDDIGIDTIEFGVTMGVAMDAGEVRWGNAQRVFDILSEIREGSLTGSLYGNGVYHLGNQLGFKRIPHIKGQGISGYDPRVFKAMGVTYATTPMGADHTTGAAIAGRSANQNKEYGELTEDMGKLDLSFELQLYTAVLDSMGCCYFIGPSWENMEIVARAINAMYGTELNRDDVINIGKRIIKSELEFNEKAMITADSNDFPPFLWEEASNPTNLKITFQKKDFQSFWDRLDEK
ncbi:MAG: aldehyde ferredoxin oxidoreductase C-terminal domain-containing protein [Promethearchaeota archaeon]|jgi:aldehyde:ferredoxin oxidoreductase